MNTLATSISEEGTGLKTNRKATEVLDRLSLVLGRIEADNRTLVEKKAMSLLAEGDARASRFMVKASERIDDWAQKGAARDDRLKPIYQGARALAGLLDGSRGEVVANNLISMGNANDKKQLIPIKEMFEEIIGMTDQNRPVFEMLNVVKYRVSGVRQDHRETVPKILAEKFSRALTETEWSALHLAMGRTDLLALGETLSAEQIRKVLTDKTFRQDEISKLEETIRGLGAQNQGIYLKKAEELAEFMVTGHLDPERGHQFARSVSTQRNLLRLCR